MGKVDLHKLTKSKSVQLSLLR